MALFSKLFAEIFRDYSTDGVPSSGAQAPVKSDIRAWGLSVESAISASPALGLTFLWDTGTADADPGSGKIRGNNASVASMTTLYVSETSANSESVATVLQSFDDSTSTVKGWLILRDVANSANSAYFTISGSITDGGTYDKITVTYQASHGSFTSGATIGLAFFRTGDPGSIGGSTGATDNALLRADGTGGSTAQSSAITVDDSGNLSTAGSVKSSGTGGLGYATGAGGTVTQATSKATGVTLNKITGQITLNNAALAASTTVSFTLTNSAIAAGDVLVLNHISAGTAGSYTLNAQCAGGTASINVRNVSLGSLSEAIVVSFAVIKAVTS